MPEVHEVDPARPDLARVAIDAAVKALNAGQLVIVPTETVYGLAARPDLPEATARVFRAKRRSSGLNLPVLTGTAQGAWDLGRPDTAARALASAFWPGPLTLVLPRTARSAPWRLGDRNDTIALRVPDHSLSQALLERTGPLAATSANLSGRPPLGQGPDLVEAFGSAVAVYVILTPGRASSTGRPSTVVDLAEGSVSIVRTGAIHPEAVRAAVEAIPRPGTTSHG